MVPKILLVTAVTFLAVALLGGIGLTLDTSEQQLTGIANLDSQSAGYPMDNPTAAETETRKIVEAQILASTVQILIESWTVAENELGYIYDSAISHATVMDNSKLLTHNHFSFPLPILNREEGSEAYVSLKLLDTEGKQLFQAPVSDFELAYEDQETLVFAYKDESRFESLGLMQAEFYDWTSVPLQAGMEVAQIDWDGSATRVDWTTILEVKLDEGIPFLVLEDGVKLGASGGGIFWEGKHIANVWQLRRVLDSSDNVIDTETTVALNTAQVANS